MTRHRAGMAERKLREKVRIDAETGCHVWTGRLDAKGYGRLKRGEQRSAHRVAYTLHRGEIPAGLVIDHLRRNRACVNPDHMEAVTNRVNVLRGEGITAEAARKTHCPHGHPYDEANTYVTSKGARLCRSCTAARWALHADAINANRRRKAALSEQDEPNQGPSPINTEEA